MLAAMHDVTAAIDPFLAFDRYRQRQLVWNELIGKGALPWDQAIRTAADGLRDDGMLHYEHLDDTSPAYDVIRDVIEQELRAEVPLFDRGDGVHGHVRAIVSGPDSIARECWRAYLLAVVGPEPIDRDEAIRLTAECARNQVGLFFQRLRRDGVIAAAIDSAIDDAICRGELIGAGGRLARAVDLPHAAELDRMRSAGLTGLSDVEGP
jgi:hypothetical protein